MAAVEELITESIDIWASAVKRKSSAGRGGGKKIELYGVKKLRELILDLAVRGLLVPQDSNEEPASVLLERIADEKAQQVKSKKTKKQNELLEIGDYEKPFRLPMGWEYCRLGGILQISSGTGLTAKNMSPDGKIPVYGGNGINGHHNKGNVSVETLVIGRVGFYCGSIHITPKLAWVTDNAFITTFSKVNIYLHFLEWLLKATNLKEDENATAQPVISGRKIYPIIVALPPLAEQHRIVAKVDELMALCDQLEQQTESSLTAHKTLVQTLLGALTQAAATQPKNDRQNATDAPTPFTQAWNRLAEHFDTVFTTEDSIEQLKQTILQLAVMGKLVPQDPNDEPASDLLKRIAAEKAELVKAKKIKKQKELPEIGEEEKPFELPDGWELVRLDDLSSLITKGSSPKWQGVEYTDDPSQVLFVTSENVGVGELLLDNKKYVELEFNNIQPRSILQVGDFLMNIVGASIGRTATYNVQTLANINQAVCLIRLHESLRNNTFLLKFFNSEVCKRYMFDKQVDNARANLSMGNIAKFVIPLPPSKEQHRIVAKVDELMALCDQLKARLTDAQATQLLLADAVTEQAIH